MATTNKHRVADFEKLLNDAADVGYTAANNFLFAHPNYRGPCGFAWVVVKPANCGFAKWLTETGNATKNYDGGVRISAGRFLTTQCIDTKEKFAYAMAKVIADAGLNCYADSRMD